MVDVILQPDDFETEGEDIDEIIQLMIDEKLSRINIGIPAIITSFNEDNKTVSVKIASRVYSPSTKQEFQMPVINNVPILYQYGNGNCIYIKPASGDYCWLTFCQKSIDELKEALSPDVKVASKRRFNVSDCVAILGFRSLSEPLKTNGEDMWIGQNEYNGTILPSPSGISIKDGRYLIGNSENELFDILSQLLLILKTIPEISLAIDPLIIKLAALKQP